MKKSIDDFMNEIFLKQIKFKAHVKIYTMAKKGRCMKRNINTYMRMNSEF